MSDNILGQAKDGREFTADSPEVIAFLEKFPDVTLEAAIGSVVMEYDRSQISEESTGVLSTAEDVKAE